MMIKKEQRFFNTINNAKYMFKLVWCEKTGKAYVFLKLLMALIMPVFVLLYSIIPGLIINELVKKQLSEKLIIYLCTQLLLPIIHHIINAVISYFSAKYEMSFYRILDEKYLYYISCMDYETLENPKIQVLKERTNETIGYTLESVEKLIQLLSSIISLLAISSIIALLNPIIILIVIFVIYINSLATKWLIHANYMTDKEKDNLGPSRHAYSSTINSLYWAKDIRLFNLKTYLIDKFTQVVKEEDKYNQKKIINSQKAGTVHSLTNFAQQCVVYIYVIYCVLKEGLGIGDMTIFMSAISQFSGALNNVSSTYTQISGLELRINDLNEFMSIVPLQYCSGTKKPLVKKDSVIEFKNVTFKYPGSEIYALNKINIKIKLDERLCIVGLNGSGKSTFIKLLTRLYMPESGDILLDGININEFDYEEYQSLFAPVFQDIALFSFSLKDNIVLTKDEDISRLNKVIEQCELTSLVKKLPNGYDTEVYKSKDEGGFMPSGGEEQKIAIARAVYQGGEIFILDEPTSALDPMAEYEIYTQFNNIITEKCAILVTHRLSAVQLADKVAVFDNGQIMEYGTHKELYTANGIYTEMFDKQSQFYRDNPAESE